MSLVLDWLQKWLQLLAPSYVYIICNKTLQHLPLRDVPVGFPGGAVVESPPANAGDAGSGPGPGGSHMLQSN